MVLVHYTQSVGTSQTITVLPVIFLAGGTGTISPAAPKKKFSVSGASVLITPESPRIPQKLCPSESPPPA